MSIFKLEADLLKALSGLKKTLAKLPPDAIRAFMYIWDNISVGDIIVAQDLRKIHSINNPEEVLRLLQEYGLIERGEGCYNLSSNLRLLKKKIRTSLDLLRILERIP